MKTEICSFSGWKVYPGHGIRYIRADSKIFLFRSSKEKLYFLQKQKNAKFRWTQVYRKLHKKGVTETRTRRRKHVIKKVQRNIVGINMEDVAKIKRETKENAELRRQENLKQLRERRAKAKAASKQAQATGTGGKQPKGPKQRGTGAKGR